MIGFNEYKYNNLKGKKALVTGASSGIGYSVAFFLASLGCDLFLTARRESLLESLKSEINKSYPDVNVSILSGDISIEQTIQNLESNGFLDVDILINNAGLALGKDNVENASLEDWETMLDVNVKSVFKLTKKVLPFMKNKSLCSIVFVSSIAGHIPYEGGSVYTASKHALRAFASSLRLELTGSNIRVFQISPGMVNTEFSTVRFKGDKQKADLVYEGMTPLTSEDIAYQIVNFVTLPNHVVVDDMIITPLEQGGVGKVVRNNIQKT